MPSSEPEPEPEPEPRSEPGSVSPEPAPTRITLIRHGESNVTVDRVIGGHRSCTGLSDLGRRQSVRLATRLAETGDLDVDFLVTSHFARAIETAEIIRPSLRDVEIGEPWPEFGEHDPGPEIDGMTFDAYIERFGRPDWSGDPNVEIFPGGESTADFHRRVRGALDRLVDTFPGKHVAVACHGGVIDATFRLAVDAPTSGAFSLWTLNTSLSEFLSPVAQGAENADHGDASLWRVVRYNDAAHLAGLPDATPRNDG